jgi:hypothetical protein
MTQHPWNGQFKYTPKDSTKTAPKPFFNMSLEQLQKELPKKQAMVWTLGDEQIEILREGNQYMKKNFDTIEAQFSQYVRAHPDDKVAKGIWNRYEKKGQEKKECYDDAETIQQLIAMKSSDILD